MIELNTPSQEVKRIRTFTALEAIEPSKTLRISYTEQVYIDGELLKTETHSYTRDYDYWKESEIGSEIMNMINEDLRQPDPSIPRNIN
jgi:hypothetical protein